MAARAKHARKHVKGPMRGVPGADRIRGVAPERTRFREDMVSTFRCAAPVAQIAADLGISPEEVAWHLEEMCRQTFPVGGYDIPLLQPDPGIVDGVAYYLVNGYMPV